MKLLILLNLLFALHVWAKDDTQKCQTNPLRDKEYCRHFWSLCKSLGIKRLDGIRGCLEKSQSYEEGVKCFERSWLEDLFGR